MPPSKQLDLILRLLKESELKVVGGWVFAHDIYSALNGFTGLRDQWNKQPKVINYLDLEKALLKLEDEKFISYEKRDIGINLQKADAYKLTFDGDALLELDNGYSGRLKKSKNKLFFNMFWGVLISAGSGIIGTVIGGNQAQSLLDRQEHEKLRHIDSMINAISNDTIRLKILINNRDTSLVRLVNTPKSKH